MSKDKENLRLISEKYVEFLKNNPKIIFNDKAMQLSFALAYYDNKENWEQLALEEQTKKMQEKFWDAFSLSVEDDVVTSFVTKVLYPYAKIKHTEEMMLKASDGYSYGEIADDEKKETPCLIPFEELVLQDGAECVMRRYLLDVCKILAQRDEDFMKMLRKEAAQENGDTTSTEATTKSEITAASTGETEDTSETTEGETIS